MRRIWIFILLLVFSCQPSAVSGQQTSCTEDTRPCVSTENLRTSKSENSLANDERLKSKGEEKAHSSKFKAHSFKTTVDRRPLSVDYFESQIRLADSLYKNYLPQYNFEEVKAAVMFFDSLRLTTDLLESENLKTSESEKSCEQRAMSNEPFLESENLKTSESEKRLKSQGRNAQSSQHEAQSTSQVFSFSDSQIQNNVDHHELLKFQNSKILEFLRARAHYYHAVGLTERDDIVGACEHYFKALEIMETELEIEKLKTSKSGKGSEQRAMSHEQKFRNAHSSKLEAQSPDYEKIRFLSLIYTRLGELFLNENYCDLAISKYRKALRYVLLLGENKAVANTYKCLGNSYQLYNMPDSALYYYNKSLETNSELPNRLDVEKCIAQILFDKGEKDSAYVLLKNNLREIDNENLKYSYHYTLGNVYYSDKKYDSALYYLETSLDNDIVTKKVAFTTKLSAIYDSLGDYDKRDYYDNFSVKMFLNHANKEVDNKQLQVLYDNYKERKNEREKSIAKVRTRKLIIAISLGVFVILVSFTIFLKYRNKRHIDKLTEKIDDYANENKQLAEDFQKASSKKDKIIKQQKKEIEEIKNELSKKNRVDLDAYYDSDICKKITARKDSDFSCLKEDELALLMKSADTHLNNISTRLYEQFPTLNTNDIYTICLIILNVEKNKFPYLLSRDRKTIYDRFSKIRKLMNIDAKQDLFIHIKDNYLR